MSRIHTRSQALRPTASDGALHQSRSTIRPGSPIVLVPVPVPVSPASAPTQRTRSPSPVARSSRTVAPPAPAFDAALALLASHHRKLGFSPEGSDAVMQSLKNLAYDDAQGGLGLLHRDLDVDGLVEGYERICAARFPNDDRTGWGDAARIAVKQLRQLQGIESTQGRQLRSGTLLP